VIHLLVGESEEEKQKRQLEEFCKACRAAKRNIDCGACSKHIRVEKEADTKHG